MSSRFADQSCQRQGNAPSGDAPVHVLRVAVSQRICPSWRTPFFDALGARPAIRLTVFYGAGAISGATQNDRNLASSQYTCLRGIRIPVVSTRRQTLRVIHPGLPWHLSRGHFDVVIVEPSTNLPNDLLAFLYCLVSGAKLVWTEYGAPDGYTPLRRLIQPAVHFLRLRASAHVAFSSAAERELIADGVDPERIVRTLNTMDVMAQRERARAYEPVREAERARLGIEADEFVVAYIGALEERKRIANVICAVKSLRRNGLAARGLIIGDGQHAAVLRKSAEEDDRDAVIFVGRREEDAALYLGISDVVVLPGEGGQAIPHAFACGKPVIATGEAWVGGSSVYDYIDDGVEGFVVARDDVEAICRCLRELIADSGLCATMGAAAARRADRLTIEEMVSGFERAIQISAQGSMEEL